MPKNKKIIITIDGPAGAGKTTMAKYLAEKFHMAYLDTGAIYRAFAWLAICLMQTSGKNQPKDLLDIVPEVINAYQRGKLMFVTNNNGMSISIAALYDNQNIMQFIRTQEVSDTASKISVYPTIRSLALEVEQDFAESGNLVAEGRDMGTVVFPDAPIKYFLTAAPRTRAERRQKDDPSVTVKDILARDERDSNRTIAPLTQPKDAVVINSTGLNLEETKTVLCLLTKANIAALS